MDPAIQPLQDRIKSIGKLLWIFTICWFVFNLIALLIVVATVIGFRIAGTTGARDTVIETFARTDLFPDVSKEAILAICAYDYDNFLEHFWPTLFLIVAATAFFVATMIFIMKIARAMMKGDILSHSAIRSLHILAWLYLIHGIVGQLWGMVGQFVAQSNTMGLLYFSFMRDVCLYSFAFSGSGIEWGLLLLAFSWILKHARLMRDEQLLVV